MEECLEPRNTLLRQIRSQYVTAEADKSWSVTVLLWDAAILPGTHCSLCAASALRADLCLRKHRCLPILHHPTGRSTVAS
eukprot:3022371-Rhodomonas_salina.10